VKAAHPLDVTLIGYTLGVWAAVALGDMPLSRVSVFIIGALVGAELSRFSLWVAKRYRAAVQS